MTAKDAIIDLLNKAKNSKFYNRRILLIDQAIQALEAREDDQELRERIDFLEAIRKSQAAMINKLDPKINNTLDNKQDITIEKQCTMCQCEFYVHRQEALKQLNEGYKDFCCHRCVRADLKQEVDVEKVQSIIREEASYAGHTIKQVTLDLITNELQEEGYLHATEPKWENTIRDIYDMCWQNHELSHSHNIIDLIETNHHDYFCKPQPPKEQT